MLVITRIRNSIYRIDVGWKVLRLMLKVAAIPKKAVELEDSDFCKKAELFY